MSVIPKNERRALRRAVGLLEIDKSRFAWSVAAGSGAVGSGIGLSAVSAWLIARAAQLPPVLDLSVAATSVRAFGVGKAVFRYLERISSHWVALYGMSNLRTSVYASLADSPTDVVTSVRRGDLLARTGADVDEVGDVVVKSLLPAAVAVIVGIISVAIVGWLSPLIGAVLAACLLLSGLVGPYLAMRGARIAEQAQVTDRAVLTAESLTLLESASELRVSGRLDAMEKSRLATEARIQEHRDAAARPTALAAAIDTLALGISVVAALFIGTRQVMSGDLNGIELVVCALTPLASFEATTKLAEAGVQLVRSASAASRIMELLDAAAVRKPAGSSLAGAGSGEAASSSNGLVARDLVIGWPGEPDVAGPLSLSLERGKAIAVVGPSGIGKSTLLYTLAGMLEPHAGSVTLDGQEVSTLNREDVSAKLVLTAEDAHIFETTVLENLRVARASVTPEEAAELLERAGLAEWLSQLPEGVETVVGSDAATISGGERRRLLLARALASPADILLLDEPGEHLDGETADALIRDLLQAGEGTKGIVLVTHRLSPLDAADEVIVLGADGVRARGTHDALLDELPEYRWSALQEEFS